MLSSSPSRIVSPPCFVDLLYSPYLGLWHMMQMLMCKRLESIVKRMFTKQTIQYFFSVLHVWNNVLPFYPNLGSQRRSWSCVHSVSGSLYKNGWIRFFFGNIFPDANNARVGVHFWSIWNCYLRSLWSVYPIKTIQTDHCYSYINGWVQHATYWYKHEGF